MTAVLFSRLGRNDTLIYGVEVPRVKERVFLDGEVYEVTDVTHFPDKKGNRALKSYKEIEVSFVRVGMVKIKF